MYSQPTIDVSLTLRVLPTEVADNLMKGISIYAYFKASDGNSLWHTSVTSFLNSTGPNP